MDQIVITKAQLEGALAQWEKSHRDGGTRSYGETQALAIEQVAAESSEYLWGLLGGNESRTIEALQSDVVRARAAEMSARSAELRGEAA